LDWWNEGEGTVIGVGDGWWRRTHGWVGKELRRSKIWREEIYPGIAGVLRGARYERVAELILSWTEVH